MHVTLILNTSFFNIYTPYSPSGVTFCLNLAAGGDIILELTPESFTQLINLLQTYAPESTTESQQPLLEQAPQHGAHP